MGLNGLWGGGGGDGDKHGVLFGDEGNVTEKFAGAMGRPRLL